MPSYLNEPVISVTDDTREPAVQGRSSTRNGIGVYGHSTLSAGVQGESDQFDGVLGLSKATGHSGVAGVNDEGTGNGVYGHSTKSDGIIGITMAEGKAGVAGVCDDNVVGNGIYGRSKLGNGVLGYSSSDAHAGVSGLNDNAQGIGLYGKGGRLAAFFEGDVEVTGDIRLTNADCAEDFNISGAETIEPGTVVVLGDEGGLYPSQKAYDKRVAGVVSGAGDYRPGIVLDKQQSSQNRQPIALLGKVFCKVDAQFSPVDIGDLLTTSPTPGYAMRADDALQAFGAVIGKALRPLNEGQGLIPILIALQ